MTLQEIHKELHDDYLNTVGTLDNRLRKFGSVVLKSSRYPIRRHYECKSIEKRNRFWVMLTAIKRGEWNDPVIDYYCVFDRPEGLFCAFLDPKGGNSFVFPPHFFSRYRERVLGGSGMSGPDLIKFFVNRIWTWSFMLLSDDRKKGVASMDEVLSKEKIDALTGFPVQAKEFIHFGLTSQDINNTSVPLSIKEALEQVYYPLVEELIEQLHDYAEEWKNIPMLAKTHGQPASPTRLGKEIMVYVYRLEEQLRSLKETPVTAKFGGATGNYNAHHVAYPQYDWREFGNKFVSEKLGLEREQYTTQISNYDWLAAIFDAMKRINTIVIDLDRDFWMYISMDYFKQKIKAGEVGSSAMPHKVNPIDYENSEGNLGIANAILQFLAAKLPVSRLQRDLTDSTVLRNVGVPVGHAVIAFQSTLKGLRKLILNEQKLQEDLDNTWAVVAEAIQTILRREAYPNPYETLKALTRTNERMTAETIAKFIETLDVSEDVKEELRAITPANYTGL